MAKIITGHRGVDHITSDDVSSFQQGVVGDYDYLLSDNPDDFVATIGANNSISLCDADIVIQGTHARIFSTDSVQLEQGTAGVTRIDYICAKYTRDNNGVEDVTVIAKTGTTEPPELEQTDIRGAGTVREVALWSVTLNGNVPSEPVRVIPYINSLQAIQNRLHNNILLANNLQTLYNALNNTVAGIQTSIATINSNINTLNNKKYVWTPFTIKNQSAQNDELFSTDIGNYVSTYKTTGGAIDVTATTINMKDASGNSKCQHIFYSNGNKAINIGGTWYGQPFIQYGYAEATPKTKSTRNVGSVTIPKHTVKSEGKVTIDKKSYTIKSEGEVAAKTVNCVEEYYSVEKQITFAKPYSSAPRVYLSPVTVVPEIISVGVTSVTTTGFKIHIKRTNETATGVNWIALGNV